MFFHVAAIKKGGRFYLCHMASMSPQKFSFVRDVEVLKYNYLQTCDDLKEVITTESISPSIRYSLRLSSQLLFGLLKIHLRKVNILYVDLSKFEKNLIKHIHNLHKEKRPRGKRQQPAVQSEITAGTDNLETRGNDCVTVRNISDITLEEEVLVNPNVVNDNFGEIPELLDPSANVAEDQVISVMEVDSDCFAQLQRTNIVVPEIHIEPTKETRKRKAPEVPRYESIQQTTPVSSELMNTISSNAPKIYGNPTIALQEMKRDRCQTGPFQKKEDIGKVLQEQIEKSLKTFKDFLQIPSDTSMTYLRMNERVTSLTEVPFDEAVCDTSDDDYPGENAADSYTSLQFHNSHINVGMQGNMDTLRVPDASREEFATSPLLSNAPNERTVQGSLPPDTIQFHNSHIDVGMQGNMDILRVPDASREEFATSPLLSNAPNERTVQGSLPPDMIQFNERGHSTNAFHEVTHHNIPMDAEEIGQVPSTSMGESNPSIERTPVMVDDPPESSEVKEQNRILREFWDPEPLFTKIAISQERGEEDVDIEKIVGKDMEAASSVTGRKAYARAFMSLLQLKQAGHIKIEKKPNSSEIRHISVNLDNSQT